MSDYLALLVTLECNYQPGVLFPALVTLRWLRTSPIYAGFAVPSCFRCFFLLTAMLGSPSEVRVPRSSSDRCPTSPQADEHQALTVTPEHHTSPLSLRPLTEYRLTRLGVDQVRNWPQ